MALPPFTIVLPIAPGDSANIAYGIWPYGVHSGGHAPDGHPGFDLEYRPGASVLAAADGVVISVTADAHDSSRSRVQVRHERDRGGYMTDYSNLTAVAVTQGAVVSQGQPLGLAGLFADGRSAMTHFQIADPTRNQVGVAESAIASPADFVAESARASLDAIWATASYRAEWCEPFLTNPRNVTFPLVRAWTADSPSSLSRIVITCPSDVADMTWVAYGSGDVVTEQGIVTLNYSARPTTFDVRLLGGGVRAGVYDIVSGTLRLSLAPAGLPRPTSLDGAERFTTTTP